MAQKPTDAQASDNVGQSGTDNLKTYQDEKGLKAADKAAEPKQKSDDPNKDPEKPTALAHGEKSPAAKQDEATAADLEKLSMPAQMLPENQDESVKPQ